MKSKVIWRIAAVFAAALSVVVASLLVVPVFASAQVRHVSGERADGAKPTIVLEHGGFADGSSWDQVISILQREGYTVDAPPNPLQGLASDSAYLASYLKTISGPIILVGHSYGGMVITNAAIGDPNVKGLVYADAFEPAARRVGPAAHVRRAWVLLVRWRQPEQCSQLRGQPVAAGR